MSFTFSYQQHTSVITTDLGSEVVLLHPDTQEMFTLNEVGRTIWLSLPASRQTLLAQVLHTFDVTAEDADADLDSLLDRLVHAGLVLPT